MSPSGNKGVKKEKGNQSAGSEKAIKPRLAVSACLLGQPVRYDGRDKNCMDLQALAACAELVPVCPEVGMGLPVPRPPIEVWQSPRGLGLRQVNDPRVELSEPMTRWFESRLDHWRGMDGFVLKSRSPSCGNHSTPVVDAEGRPVAIGDGLFVALLRQYFPTAPIIDEQAIGDPGQRNAFLQQAQAHAAKRLRKEQGESHFGLR